jgi:dihydroorotate dehydrogenase electron transfer subunit
VNDANEVTVRGGAQPGHYLSTLLEKRDLSERYFLVVMTRPPGFEDPKPGTFIHLLVPGEKRFFLRRPFSILGCDSKSISLIIVEKGLGTRVLREAPIGTDLDFIGPLGSAFPQAPRKRILAVGGGVGLAPLYFYGVGGDRDACEEYRLLYGARTKDDLFLDGFDWSLTGVDFATDDGTHGFSGNVVELAGTAVNRPGAPFDAIFSCGPRSKNIPHFVSLENRMACGVGACRSCVVPVKIGNGEVYRTVCKDGPVFDARTIVWEDLPEV